MLRKCVYAMVFLAVVVGALFVAYPRPVLLSKAFSVFFMLKPITIQPIKDGIYTVSGGIANTGFIIGDTGVIIYDAQMFTPTASKVLKGIAAITHKPVTTIILSHSDPDHVNGLPAYPRGLQIIAQENTRLEMLAALADPTLTTMPSPPELKDYLPTHDVKDREDLVIDGVQMELLHIAPAHTDGDLILYLPARNVVFAGDILTPGASQYPGIHLNKHGSSLGWMASMRALIALNADVYVSGHGDPQTVPQLQALLDVAQQRRAQIKTLFDQHKNLDEIKAVLNDPKPTGLAALFPTFTETTYQELESGGN